MNALPSVVSLDSLADDNIRLTIAVDADDLVFAGHFPGQPILPGVAQIDWAARLARRYFDGIGTFLGMEQIKFHQVIRPPARVYLCLDWRPARGRLFFDYRGNADSLTYSSGCLHFSDTE